MKPLVSVQTDGGMRGRCFERRRKLPSRSAVPVSCSGSSSGSSSTNQMPAVEGSMKTHLTSPAQPDRLEVCILQQDR